MKKYNCPICDHQLKLKYDGYECRNFKCKLYKKGKDGWVFHTGEALWSKQQEQINSFYHSNERILFQYEFIKLKRLVYERDKYTCQKCGKTPIGKKGEVKLIVHHIIDAQKEMALYLDIDNLMLLCENCHKDVHKYDKFAFR